MVNNIVILELLTYRQDGSSAAMAHLGKGLKNRAKELPEKIPSSQVVVAKSKNFLVKGKQTIAKYVSCANVNVSV